MDELTDPRPLGRVVTIVVAVWLIAEVFLHAALFRAVTAGTPAGSDNRAYIKLVGVAVLVQLISYLATVVLVGRWIWRTNRNAHALANGLTIKPGWAVGWFFVPIANLFKPFQGLKETWQVSHDPANWRLAPVPALLRYWWGLWLFGSLGRGVSLVLDHQNITVAPRGWLDAAVTLFVVAYGLLLIPIVRRLSETQARTIAAQTFA